MTAGRGIVHEEYHSPKFTKEGGTFEMCQLWVNLPKKHKMTKPRYQAILNEQIPSVPLPLGAPEEEQLATVRLIAGEMADIECVPPLLGGTQVSAHIRFWNSFLMLGRVSSGESV